MQFRFGEWFSEVKAQVKAFAGGVSTFCAKGAGEEFCKVLDYFIVSELLDNRMENFEVVEECGFRPPKWVRCEIRVATVDKWNKEQNVPSKLRKGHWRARSSGTE